MFKKPNSLADNLDPMLKDRLRLIIERSGYRSNRAVAKASGMSSSQLNSILTEPKKFGPGAFLLANLCATLGTDPNTLLGISETGRPSFNSMISAWSTGGGSLASLDFARDYFDVFEIPQAIDTKLRITRLGAYSLAAEVTGITVRIFFQEAMNQFSDPIARRRIIDEYSTMSDKKMDVSIQDVNIPKLNRMDNRVSIQTQRLLLRVTDEHGNPLIASYSLHI